ncbi:MAG: branched-chain-amino-acid transaminase [Verrucomicrobia bacterium CG_4_10_14_3_um_filter_43_23]|nr:MAG: branched-chain-amino-acid transaminase [Verrucomicrobia bacterium CG1_02_43_26]PIP58824.1 MAG: branched-chain-amino-acid transaminase [Verrucomicrobia bacterium CG22_combo_CG10-13_8_21_14_all_43_17]PIX57748.1 MAG: branched-chain-amino-acid transaminase [Verrucomicrobia bacterium CG_4_10_14_3_um_filter_43_23]PIY61086.1 MAG: branched-chain-amino-acid transaminase [Verrucomicrobia bacterium CG_4_10_14_0_8_um_filter_43_34]PJA44216.1 MAG: branched-chain-amino-acid transaminase [Verrucomicrob
MKIYINGKLFDKEDAKISVFDHGLLYGDGVFEGIRLYENCVFKLDEHLERLEYSAKAIMLHLPWSRQEISDAVCELCRTNGLVDGYIRLVVTRGPGDLGIDPSSCKDPQLIIIADKIKLYPEEFYKNGLKIITVPTRRNDPDALPPMIKSLNYLNNVLAKMEAKQHGYMEAIMLNANGLVSECTGDNLFIVHKGKLFTPESSQGALKGITRQCIIEIAESLNVPVKESPLTRYDVWNADECFLTGTAAEIIPVINIDGRVIGTGTPGEYTLRFLDVFRKKVTEEGTLL